MSQDEGTPWVGVQCPGEARPCSILCLDPGAAGPAPEGPGAPMSSCDNARADVATREQGWVRAWWWVG